jgi:hypothetical protein
MTAVGQEGQGSRCPSARKLKIDRRLDIGFRRLLALQQVGMGRWPQIFGNTVGHASDGAAWRETKNESRAFRRSTMMNRIDAKGASAAMVTGGHTL